MPKLAGIVRRLALVLTAAIAAPQGLASALAQAGEGSWSDHAGTASKSGLAEAAEPGSGFGGPVKSDRRAPQPVLRVCADPNNLPFSNDREQGFENALANIVARDLGARIEYTWWAERRGFLRNTLNAGVCDVVMGIPPLDVLTPTQAYYNSTYVIVSRTEDAVGVATLTDPALRDLSIGVHLIGDDGANTPAAHVLGDLGIVDNVVGYTIYGDYREDAPPSRIVRDVAAGTIDIAIVWGPLGGYYARMSDVPLTVTPLEKTESLLPLVFQFPIGMGVRTDDHALKDRLNRIIERERGTIDALLERYGIPRV
ncbi:substrate-binding domain-containing protein [Fulvimarina sp. 2208YS6-2-32]|nr:substrate-binding domain-containing protein [Fulvimarina sp. 2208YS6-2-32]